MSGRIPTITGRPCWLISADARGVVPRDGQPLRPEVEQQPLALDGPQRGLQ
ncbi:hypothetical protein ACQPZP_14410 [Spirillospora sp. CA-142024]|uniref:hypothetical protein n=1 Tax=Spirillospora sp. CA-142024 TaxID=3240036 RepID=UPI003D91FACB